jgi:hypothetical protein
MSYHFYDRNAAARQQVRGERELRRHATSRTGYPERVILPPPQLTEAELAEARIAVDTEEADCHYMTGYSNPVLTQ